MVCGLFVLGYGNWLTRTSCYSLHTFNTSSSRYSTSVRSSLSRTCYGRRILDSLASRHTRWTWLRSGNPRRTLIGWFTRLTCELAGGSQLKLWLAWGPGNPRRSPKSGKQQRGPPQASEKKVFLTVFYLKSLVDARESPRSIFCQGKAKGSSCEVIQNRYFYSQLKCSSFQGKSGACSLNSLISKMLLDLLL